MGMMAGTGKIQIEGHEVVKKMVKPHGTTGQIYLPISWIGCEVTVIRTSDRCEPCEK